MSYTHEDIKEIFQEDDFKELIRRFKRIGILAYNYNNQIGEYTFFGDHCDQLVLTDQGPTLEPEEKTDTVAIQQAVKKYQSGALKFEAFAREVAAAGIFSWETNLEKLSVEFYNKRGEVTYREVFASIFD